MKRFEDFPIVKEFVDKDKSKIIKYVELVYAKTSELVSMEDLDERKKKAMEMTGITDNTIPEMENKSVNELIFTYLSFYQNSNLYHNFLANQYLFWQQQNMLMTPIQIVDDADLMMKRILLKDTLSEKSGKLLVRINKQREELYPGKQEREVAEIIIRKEAVIRSPEQRLKKAV